jgi:hypothetical protein
MSLVRVLENFVAIGDPDLYKRLGETGNKISFEGRCMVRPEQVVLVLSIVSVYFSAPSIDLNVTRPVSSRDFDEDPRLKLWAISNFAALFKIETKVSDVRVCREGNLGEPVSKLSLSNSWGRSILTWIERW